MAPCLVKVTLSWASFHPHTQSPWRITHSGNMQSFFIAMSVFFGSTGGNRLLKTQLGRAASSFCTLRLLVSLA